MHTKPRFLIPAAAALLVLAMTAGPARALTNADLRAGVFGDNAGVGFGGGVLTNVGTHTNWYFNPNLEAAFGDGSDEVALNADFHYDFSSASTYTPYLGAGPAMLWRRTLGSDREQDSGLDVLGGLAARHGDVRPFVQMKGVITDRSQVALVGGVRF